MVRANRMHNKDEALANMQELNVWAERMMVGIYLEGSRVTELVVLSSAISGKNVGFF